MKFTCFLFFILPLQVLTQQDTTKRFYFSEVQFQTGFNNFGLDQMTKNEFLSFVPNSLIALKDYSNFSRDNFTSSNRGYFSFLAGIGFRSSENHKLRVGVSSFRTTNFMDNYTLNESFPYDTLTSSQTGAQTFVDSTNFSSVSFMQQAENIMFNIDYLFQMNASKRISFFTGFGIAAGFGFNVENRINYHKSFYEPDYSHLQPPKGIYEEEVEPGSSYFIGSTYIPIGMRLRLGVRRNFWKNLSLSAEYKGLINVSNLVPKRTIAGFGNRFGLGIIVHW